jgi:hypothetical protein
MIDSELKFPDWAGHPQPPRLSFEAYEAWIIGEILPALRAAGKLTDEELRKDFDRNEGLMTEAFRL